MPAYSELAEGKTAPAFALPDADGQKTALSDFKGKWVVVYFYPKDDTAGCTIEGIDFTKEQKNFEKLGAKIFGISPDDGKSHCKFRDKHALKITLLSDMDHAVATAYGVWREKKMYGNTYMGIHRSTFLIDPSGKIANAWYGVQPLGHAHTVLETLQKRVKPA